MKDLITKMLTSNPAKRGIVNKLKGLFFFRSLFSEELINEGEKKKIPPSNGNESAASRQKLAQQITLVNNGGIETEIDHNHDEADSKEMNETEYAAQYR